MRIRRQFKNDKYLLLFEQYLANIFNLYGQVESILLGAFFDDSASVHRINSVGKYKISKRKLKDIAKGAGEEEHLSPVQGKILKDSAKMSPEELEHLMSEHFPEYFREHVRHWYKYDDVWEEIDPASPATVFMFDHIMGKNKKVHIKRIPPGKCDLTITREIIDDYSWRFDFSGKWPGDK
jgi:hypothetical protein